MKLGKRNCGYSSFSFFEICIFWGAWLPQSIEHVDQDLRVEIGVETTLTTKIGTS